MSDTTAGNARVLVVDDQAPNVRLLQAILTPRGYDVSTASSGEEALAILEKDDMDLVLLDIVMPEITGIDTLERLLQADTGARVVMVSSVGAEDTVRDCLKKGAKSFLQKPLQKEGMLNILKNVCQQTGVEL